MNRPPYIIVCIRQKKKQKYEKRLQKPTTVVLEEMRIEEIETTDKKIKRTWSYVKKEALPKIPATESTSLSAREKAESEVNLLKNNSYISRVS
ncbi:hypothetical protein B9Z55_016559 [Caenorhabditis nigoni]|uniref:Uncharacterized protein n=1 Tax=Caenorhabditis nigoni TaxID=1611254 RepID=A0A2G5T5N2_9PELO|nr:hypothetical protein B9Z55_016559 [Caenorhabditis nigoni]